MQQELWRVQVYPLISAGEAAEASSVSFSPIADATVDKVS